MQKDNSVSVPHKNLQVLATEMYKVSNNMSPAILNDIFASSFKIRKVYSVYDGIETLTNLGPKIYEV